MVSTAPALNHDERAAAALEIEQLADLLQRHAELAMEQDVLQAQKLLAALVAIAVLAGERRLERADSS